MTSWLLFTLLLGAPEATPTQTTPAAPAATATPVPAGARRLGDVKLKATRGEIEKKLGSSSGTAGPGSTDLPEREEVPKTKSVVRVPKVEDHVDKDGHGEAWWRDRARKVTRELASAGAALEAAESDLERMSDPGLAGQSAVHGGLLARLRERVREARERLADAERERDRMQEDARRADAWPGWLR